ncbi:MAG: hypothetical protein GY939_14945 [Actinomycetia bacterium]|nr:hypothetical protein [Actinomycetes bacterium]
MTAFLGRFRRRLRLIWAWATTAWLAPVVASVTVVVVGIGWVAPWGWPEPMAAGLVVATLVLVVALAGVQRLPLGVVARSADRGLTTGDSFSAALQFGDDDGPFTTRIKQRADHLAAGANPSEAAPFHPYGSRWGIAIGLGGLAMALALFPNPQDDVRAERAATQELLTATADRLEEEAAALAEDPRAEETAEELAALAEELRQTEDLAAAQELLDEAQQTLAEARPDNFASQRAAAEGLDRSLADRPLNEAGGSAAEQLAATAAGLDGLSADDQASLDALAERLEDLADAQAAGNPDVAATLADAAAALAAGDIPAAQAALGEAALAQGVASDAVASQLAAGQAADALSRAAASLGNPSSQPGSGQGQGSGQGSGSGSGQGSGQGQGSGGAGGGAQGQVGGAGGGSGSGQGGVGTPGGTDQARVDTNDGQMIVDPLSLNPGDETPLGGVPDGASSEVIGQGDGPTTASLAQVRLSDIVGDYAERATASADQHQLPPSQRRLVGDYFDLLSQTP